MNVSLKITVRDLFNLSFFFGKETKYIIVNKIYVRNESLDVLSLTDLKRNFDNSTILQLS